jgi:hypothetical protein
MAIDSLHSRSRGSACKIALALGFLTSVAFTFPFPPNKTILRGEGQGHDEGGNWREGGRCVGTSGILGVGII